mmetsp:Transcript_115702/g.180789  ORF Transcript_115702/g.180789 Transcript_115702/m.180789 type:complete len:179 (-) Transcript_115702:55-591(-)
MLILVFLFGYPACGFRHSADAPSLFPERLNASGFRNRSYKDFQSKHDGKILVLPRFSAHPVANQTRADRLQGPMHRRSRADYLLASKKLQAPQDGGISDHDPGGNGSKSLIEVQLGQSGQYSLNESSSTSHKTYSWIGAAGFPLGQLVILFGLVAAAMCTSVFAYHVDTLESMANREH